MRYDKIYLVGMMGAGKSTVGPPLAERLGWRFTESDDHIERSEGMPIPDIFRERGQPYFRQVEENVIGALSRWTRAVIATGGGAFMRPANRRIMLETGFVIWLYVPPELVIARALGDPNRPNAKTREEMIALYESRMEDYAKANAKIDSSGDVNETVCSILRLMD